MPIKVPDALELHERLFELRSIFRQMTVTARDKTTEMFAFAFSLSPSNEWTNRDEYAAGLYSDLLADDLFKNALVTGALPIWTGRGGFPVELNPRVLFAHNKWSIQAVIRSGVYQPMNVRREYGDDEREAADGALLWVKDGDWLKARNALIAHRERQFGSELPADFKSLIEEPTMLQGAQMDHPRPAEIDDVQAFSDLVWQGLNRTWLNGARERWPGPDGEAVFLGNAVLQAGRAWFGDQWSDDIATVPRARRFDPEVPRNSSETALEAFINERPLREAQKSRRLWPMFDEVVRRIVSAAQSGALRCYAREADHLDLQPVGSKSWRLPDSIAVFKHCSMDPKRPFGGVPGYSAGHKVFVNASDLEALIAGNVEAGSPSNAAPESKAPQVSMRELREWVAAANQKGWSQVRIYKGAVDAFPGRQVPGRTTIIDVDTEVRRALELPARRRGAPKK